MTRLKTDPLCTAKTDFRRESIKVFRDALKKIPPQSAGYLYSFVDERYKNQSIIFTSNRAIDAWMDIFPDQIIGSAVLDRIEHNTHQIIIARQSFRGQHILKKENR